MQKQNRPLTICMAKGGNIGKGKEWGGGRSGGGGIIGGIRESGDKTPADRSTSGVEAVAQLDDCIRSWLSNSANVTAPAKIKLPTFRKQKSWTLKDQQSNNLS